MSHEIWKFHLAPDDAGVLMPAGAKVLTAREQGSSVCLWAEVDPAAPAEMRHFKTYGTGHQMPDNPGAYVGTAVLIGGTLVFHIYEPVQD